MGAGAGDFRLGPWLVRPSLDLLVRPDQEVRIRPKLMDLLVLLAEHAGEVLSRDEALVQLWSKQFIAESALSGLMAELRRVLGDDAHGPTFIETVPKSGYRLLVLPEPVEDEDGPAGATTVCVLIVADRRVPLGEGEHVIGRALDSAVRIDSTDVSRHHAKVVVRDGRATIEDLGSKNGTFVGRERVITPTPLGDGDEARVGGVPIVFRLPRCLQSTATVDDR